MKAIHLILAVIALGAIARTTYATPIYGAIQLEAQYGLSGADFTDSNRFTDFSLEKVSSDLLPTLDFAGTGGAPAQFASPFVFGSALEGGSTGPLNIALSFSFGGNTYAFTLLSATITTRSETYLQLDGNAIVRISGLSDTYATWNLQAYPTEDDLSQPINFATIKFVASGDAVPTSVPDGGSAVALLGMALIGIEGLRRTTFLAKRI
ncbi:MAG: hypothetical protein QOE70_6132 [Chthoniobacter sp.]|nr:hypothetical protein [Chthoniobacter sp.]